MEAAKGMIVRSGAGRDKGKLMVILELDGDYAFLADGKERRLAKPKRKRIKHLKTTNTLLSAADLEDITDKRLRDILRSNAKKATEEV